MVKLRYPRPEDTIKNNYQKKGLLHKAVEFAGDYYDYLLYAKTKV